MPQAAVVGRPSRSHESPPPFVCSWRVGGSDAAWVRVAGELDLAASPQLRQRLGEAQCAVRLVVLDLRELTFIDSPAFTPSSTPPLTPGRPEAG